MADFLYVIVKMIAVIHDMIMTWNDSFETVFSDKELHFLVIGFLGMGMLFVIYPLFKLLSENHVLVIAWIYVFTVIIVIVFAIEIGQRVTNTGAMALGRIYRTIWVKLVAPVDLAASTYTSCFTESTLLYTSLV